MLFISTNKIQVNFINCQDNILKHFANNDHVFIKKYVCPYMY
jgi:hypothetical protein